MKRAYHLWAAGLAGAVATAMPTAATADYFVRPYISIGDGETIDGVVVNGATNATQRVGNQLTSTVDLKTGTVKSLLDVAGAGQSAVVLGTFGDRVTFSNFGTASNVGVSFAYDGTISTGAALGAVNDAVYGYYATLFVYRAGSGASYRDYGASQYDAYKVVGESRFISFDDTGLPQTRAIAEALSGSFTLGQPGSYDVFAGLTTFVATNSNPARITLDFTHTATLGITPRPGVSYTSQSGVLLTGAGAVPEPATWAMMILGFGLIGGAVRFGRRPGKLNAPSIAM